MEILLSMRSDTPRTRGIGMFILNLFALQFISLIARPHLDSFYLQIANLILISANDKPLSSIPILVNLSINVLIIVLFLVTVIFKYFHYRRLIVQFLGVVILYFKYILLIPVGIINVSPLAAPEEQILIRLACAFNILIAFVFSALELYTNWSYRFVQKDFVNRRENSILCLFFQFAFLISTITLGSVVGSIFLISVSIFRAYQVSITVEYPLIQKSTFFYSSLNIYICIICLTATQNHQIHFLNWTFKFLIGVIVSMYFSKNACNFINMYYARSKSLEKFMLERVKIASKDINEMEQSSKTEVNYKDAIVVSKILLSKIHPDNKQWPLWWQKYNILVVNHQLSCVNDRCPCKDDKDRENKIIIEDLRRLMSELSEIQKSPHIRIMGIYLNIEIANKPLKGYYQIIKMRGEEISLSNSIDLECAIIQTRQCFNRIFIINNIVNSNLPLLKIIRFQQLLLVLEVEIKAALQASYNFIDMFTLNSVKIMQVITDSKKLAEIKDRINLKLEDLVVNYPSSNYVNLFIFLFYQYVEVYQSKQKQLKSIIHEKSVKRRLFQKEDQDIFNPDYGVIYIDLVEERGKIKKITRNVCNLYGNNYEDMLFFNINQFMPRIFGKNHYKFLANFIEMGKIKILADKNRILFAKDKNKFVFPLQARLRTEHLLCDEFGVTALIRKQQTSSQFIMFGKNGNIQEISQKIYESIFQEGLKNEVQKIKRLNLLKLLPNLIRVFNHEKFDFNPKTIYNSNIFFSDQMEIIQKLKFNREVLKGKLQNQTNSISSFIPSLQIQTTEKQNSQAHSNFNWTFYADTFRSFLGDFNYTKLTAYNLNYKLSTIKTQEFSLLLLQIISFEKVDDPFYASLQDYQGISEYLQICEEFGQINQNLEKYKSMQKKSDIMDFFLSKNVAEEQKMKKFQRRISRQGKLKPKKKKNLIIVDSEKMDEQQKALDQNSLINDFDDLAKVMNQELVPKLGSQRSSVTDQTQSQSRKQMLSNAFISKNSGIPPSFLVFINALILIKFAILIVFMVKTIMNLEALGADEQNNLLSLNIKELFQFRMINSQMQKFYNLTESRNFTVDFLQKQELLRTRSVLNQQFTSTLLLFDVFDMRNTELAGLTGQIVISDVLLQTQKSTSILQILNDLQYRFRSSISHQTQTFLLQNYLAIRNGLNKVIVTENTNFQASLGMSYDIKESLIIFGVYQIMIIFVVLSWAPVLFFISKQEKNILGLLRNMSVKQLKKASLKLKYLYDNVKLSKIGQINSILGMLNDNKFESALEAVDDKNQMRNIRLIDESVSRSIKLKTIICFMLAFFFVYSMLPLSFFLNLIVSKSNLIKTITLLEQTYFLADQAPQLLNLYLININKVYQNKTTIYFDHSLYHQSQLDDFDFIPYISLALELSNYFIDQNGELLKFSDKICSQIPCTPAEQSKNASFYDQIIEIRNKLKILEPDKLNIVSSITSEQIDQWVEESQAIEMMSWVNKIFEFSFKWNKIFRNLIKETLKMATQRFILFSCILIPFYILSMVYLEIKMIQKMNGILKQAESVHMNFPITVLLQNTYLISYFNDKIKNNK